MFVGVFIIAVEAVKVFFLKSDSLKQCRESGDWISWKDRSLINICTYVGTECLLCRFRGQLSGGAGEVSTQVQEHKHTHTHSGLEQSQFPSHSGAPWLLNPLQSQSKMVYIKAALASCNAFTVVRLCCGFKKLFLKRSSLSQKKHYSNVGVYRGLRAVGPWGWKSG